MNPLIVYVSEGARQYISVEITERDFLDISNVTVYVSFGDQFTPGDWLPTEVVPSELAYVKSVRYLITNEIAFDSYVLWLKIIDDTEINITKYDTAKIKIQ